MEERKITRLQELLVKTQMKLELEKRKMDEEFRNDFDKFAIENLSLKPKDVSLGYVPFNMNEPQARIHRLIEDQRERTGKVRCIVLKARQQGISTYCAGRTYWRTISNPLYQSVVITHRADTTQLLFDMTRRFYDLQPEDYRPKIKSSNKSGISFAGVDSSYHVYTAGSSQVGRGTTPTILHASEIAFWPNADELLAGLFQGVANVPGTEIILESTANGAGGTFYDLWQDAQDPDSEWLPIFIPWHETSEYQSTVPANFELDLGDTEYKELHNLTDEQMQWRREKTAGGKYEVFKQEYPATAEEAFLTSGRSVFDRDVIAKWNPSRALVTEQFAGPPRLQFDLHASGHLEIWKYQDMAEGYIIGADVSNGVGGDYSTAVVMDADYKIHAMFRDNHINPGSFGEMLFYLGRRFNNALIVCESNGPGSATLNQLAGMEYINLYREAKISQGSKEETLRLGFSTTAKSKPMIISGLSQQIRLGSFESPSNIMQDEMMKFMITDSGKMTAPDGVHDDTVIAAALCIEGLRTHRSELVKNFNFSKYSEFINNWKNEGI